jgi:hypothetical protein
MVRHSQTTSDNNLCLSPILVSPPSSIMAYGADLPLFCTTMNVSTREATAVEGMYHFTHPSGAEYLTLIDSLARVARADTLNTEESIQTLSRAEAKEVSTITRHSQVIQVQVAAGLGIQQGDYLWVVSDAHIRGGGKVGPKAATYTDMAARVWSIAYVEGWCDSEVWPLQTKGFYIAYNDRGQQTPYRRKKGMQWWWKPDTWHKVQTVYECDSMIICDKRKLAERQREVLKSNAEQPIAWGPGRQKGADTHKREQTDVRNIGWEQTGQA